MSSGNVTEATGAELASMLGEIQRSAFQGNVEFTLPEEEDDEEEKSSEKERYGESEVQDVGVEVAHSEETVEYGREESRRDKRRRSVEPRESDSLMLAKMLDMMMQNQLEAKRIEQEREHKREKEEREWREKMERKEEDRHKREEEREARRLETIREANAERERERETAKAQQAKLEVVTETMQKENAEKTAYTALLNAVPKYDGSTSVDAFLTSLDKQLRDSEIPLDKHLSILEHCLKGKALETYWSMIESEERFDYKSAKESLLKCMGTPLPRKIDQVGMIRYGKDESINDICEESLKHVESFLATLDSKDIKMKWILSRTLAKCRPECADDVWKICPKSVASLIVAEWEQKYESCRKVFTKKFGTSQHQ